MNSRELLVMQVLRLLREYDESKLIRLLRQLGCPTELSRHRSCAKYPSGCESCWWQWLLKEQEALLMSGKQKREEQ